jgi:hypothetical protein
MPSEDPVMPTIEQRLPSILWRSERRLLCTEQGKISTTIASRLRSHACSGCVRNNIRRGFPSPKANASVTGSLTQKSTTRTTPTGKRFSSTHNSLVFPYFIPSSWLFFHTLILALLYPGTGRANSPLVTQSYLNQYPEKR